MTTVARQVRIMNGRLEIRLPFPSLGASVCVWVCAEYDESSDDGMCGMPVELEPCTVHHPAAVVDG